MRALRSGVSRGTEALVFRGQVPPDQYARMRAPFQEGDFPGPVKYGYLNVGVVEQGPGDLEGRTVFCLYPHQSRYVVPASAVVPVPDGVPPRAGGAGGHRRDRRQRALGRRRPWSATGSPSSAPAWSGAAWPRCAAGIPGARVTLVDVDPSRAPSPRRWASRSRLPRTRTATRTSSSTPPRPRPGSRPACGCCPGDVGARPQLVRRPGDPPLPRRAVPLRPPRHPGQPGRDRSRPPGAGRRTYADRLRLALDLLHGPGVRRGPHRVVPARRSCPR